MNKSGLVNYVLESLDNVPKSLVNNIVDSVLSGIKHGIVTDGSVALVGHGTYSVTERAARDGRNPQTGEVMHIPASKSVKFKPGKDLKDEINK